MKKLIIETERLIIRPFKNSDYQEWSKGFNNRLPSQYKYDEGYDVIHPHIRRSGLWIGLGSFMKMPRKMTCIF